jgi:hypothetical protein
VVTGSLLGGLLSFRRTRSAYFAERFIEHINGS